MRQFNLKGQWVMAHGANDEPAPGRTIYPEPMRMAEPGWVERNWSGGEEVMRREVNVEDDEDRAARDWLAHVEAGRIGAGC